MLEVETPEQIAFSYSVAGIGSRGAAAVLDLLICTGVLVVLSLALFLLALSIVGHQTARVGDGARARQTLRTALKMDPDLPEGSQAQKIVEDNAPGVPSR